MDGFVLFLLFWVFRKKYDKQITCFLQLQMRESIYIRPILKIKKSSIYFLFEGVLILLNFLHAFTFYFKKKAFDSVIVSTSTPSKNPCNNRMCISKRSSPGMCSSKLCTGHRGQCIGYGTSTEVRTLTAYP